MTGGDISKDLDIPREIHCESALEKELYNHYFLVRDSDFLKHMKESIPILKERGADGSAHYPPLIMNRFAIGLARERIKGRENKGEVQDIGEMIKSYSENGDQDPLVNLMNVQLSRYSQRKSSGEKNMEARLEAWVKLSDAKAVYFREKARAYMAGVEDTRQAACAVQNDKIMARRFKRIKYALIGFGLTLFVGLPATAYFGGRALYDHAFEEFTGYTNTKLASSRTMLKSDVEEYIEKLETIANSQEKKVREMVYDDIIPQLQAGQLSPKTMRLLNELGESLENPEEKKALVDTIKFFSKMKGGDKPSEKKEENNEAPKKENEEEQY